MSSNIELLLLSNSTSDRGYLVDALPHLEAFARGAADAAFVPYAGVTIGWDAYAERVSKALAPIGLALRSVHRASDPAAAVRAATLLIVGGGNTFNLLHHCRRTGVLAALGERAHAGVRYVGWSAGANLACPTIRTTNDMPVIDPHGFDALGLVPFQINPHFTDALPPGHFGETRTQRLAEFTVLNPEVPVLALPEGSWIRVSGSGCVLGGASGARWLMHGRDAAIVRAGPLEIPAG